MNRTVCRLAIADPPYLGRGTMLYGGGRVAAFGPLRKLEQGKLRANITAHPQAHIWDDPQTHRGLVERLCAEYDGWAIAMAPDSLRHYLEWVPADSRIAIWNRPNAFPTASRVIPAYEVVIIHIPRARRGRSTRGVGLRDVLTAPFIVSSVIGSKPPAWTRWILDMLGYDQDTDTVDDLFGGSGAVSREIAQQVISL